MASALSAGDPSSFSNPEDAVIKHIHLDIDVNFAQSVIKGSAVLDVEGRQDSATHLLLDTRDLTILGVTEKSSGKPLSYTVGQPVLSFGAKLEIELPPNVPKCSICVDYETSPKSTALQWLKPEQTAGKVHPFLFSQCQAIHARSLLPCQDSPAVKMPYTAKVALPKALVGLMSAVKQESLPHPTDQTKVINTFNQKIPIPSYLVAIVVGSLESRDIGPRSKVWAEKETVEAAAFEFSETEQMLKTAEDLLGPYVWGVYDLLVLPPTFPYGGMENPCLTFVTPTLLAGDKSLASVIAHEIAHSWTGNLVTNRSPEHFWLNEGHTVFVERKIVGRMQGEKTRQLQAIGGWKDLNYCVSQQFGAEHPYTCLVPKLVGVDPDDAFSSVPYEKGSNLLMHLEEVLGGPDVFEPFLKAYIQKFQYTSIDTDDWKAFLYSYFSDKKAILDAVDWEAWFCKVGMPPVHASFDYTLANECKTLCAQWSKSTDETDSLQAFTVEDLKTMSPLQVKEFLAELLEQDPLTKKKLTRMQETYNFDAVKNSEIRFRWLRLCLRGHLEEAVPKALDFVNEQGRMKFVRPLYKDLYDWEVSRPAAVDNYKKQVSSMHSLTATIIGKMLNPAT